MTEKTIATPSVQHGRAEPEVTRAPERYIRPPVDIYETPEGLVLIADLPGVSKENLELRIDENLLTIQAKAFHSIPGETVYRECDLTGFFRQFELGEEIATDKINAELKHGVLTLQLAKTEKAKPRRIEVKVS